MPASAAEIMRRIGVPASQLRLDRDGQWRNEGERVLAQEGPLWPRKEQTIVDIHDNNPAAGAQPAAAAATPDAPTPANAPAATPAPPTAAELSTAATTGDRISIDQFMKVDMRVAKVLAAERVPKSKKLLKLLVDAGTEQRTVVAGIAESYEPEALIGRTIAVVFNLQPAKLMGIESNGMVLAAGGDTGKVTLVGFEEAVPPGTRVR